MSLQNTNRKLHLEVELTGQRGRVATRIGQNVLEAEKTLRCQHLENQAR